MAIFVGPTKWSKEHLGCKWHWLRFGTQGLHQWGPCHLCGSSRGYSRVLWCLAQYCTHLRWAASGEWQNLIVLGKNMTFADCLHNSLMLPNLFYIDAVNQGNWSLSIKLRLACFVNVEYKALTYLQNDSKIQSCSRCQYIKCINPSHLYLGKKIFAITLRFGRKLFLWTNITWPIIVPGISHNWRLD